MLEHVKNHTTAMKALYRILKPGGWGIMIVPILTTRDNSYEDPAIVSVADRGKYYGQLDHVRMSSKGDFVSRFSAAGIKVHL
jgi:predicted SAM-dependent methyltransferase